MCGSKVWMCESRLFSQSFADSIEKDVNADVTPVAELCNQALPLVQHLRDNSHLQLALSVSYHMLNTLLQYMQQQDMGLPYVSEVGKHLALFL